MEELYVVQVKKNGRWGKTFWTPSANPVSKSSAEQAVADARKSFPNEEFRVREVKPKP